MRVSTKLVNRLKLYTAGIKKRELKNNVSAVKTGTLLAKRNRNISIIEAVARGSYVVIEYVKITDNTFNRYKVIPMEWGFRDLKVGRRKVLYAQDMNDEYRTKSFVHVNIQRVLIGKQKVVPAGAFKQKIKFMITH